MWAYVQRGIQYPQYSPLTLQIQRGVQEEKSKRRRPFARCVVA